MSLGYRYNVYVITPPEKTSAERLKILLEHAKLFEKAFCNVGKPKGKKASHGIKSFAVMKKHFKAYVSGWDGAKELRAELMETDDYKSVKKAVDKHLAGRSD